MTPKTPADLEREVAYLEGVVRTLQITLRDQFAMAALQGYLASFEPTDEPTEYILSVARDCYVMADAMLEGRKDPK